MKQISYTVGQASKRTGIPQTAIRDAYNKGRLPIHRIGRRVYILASDLEAWIAAAPGVADDDARSSA